MIAPLPIAKEHNTNTPIHEHELEEPNDNAVLPAGEQSPDVAEGSGQTSPTADDTANSDNIHNPFHPLMPSYQFGKDMPPSMMGTHGPNGPNLSGGPIVPPHHMAMNHMHPIPLPGAPPMPPFGFDNPFMRKSILPSQQEDDSMEEFMEVS